MCSRTQGLNYFVHEQELEAMLDRERESARSTEDLLQQKNSELDQIQVTTAPVWVVWTRRVKVWVEHGQ